MVRESGTSGSAKLRTVSDTGTLPVTEPFSAIVTVPV